MRARNAHVSAKFNPLATSTKEATKLIRTSQQLPRTLDLAHAQSHPSQIRSCCRGAICNYVRYEGGDAIVRHQLVPSTFAFISVGCERKLLDEPLRSPNAGQRLACASLAMADGLLSYPSRQSTLKITSQQRGMPGC